MGCTASFAMPAHGRAAPWEPADCCHAETWKGGVVCSGKRPHAGAYQMQVPGLACRGPLMVAGAAACARVPPRLRLQQCNTSLIPKVMCLSRHFGRLMQSFIE